MTEYAFMEVFPPAGSVYEAQTKQTKARLREDDPDEDGRDTSAECGSLSPAKINPIHGRNRR